MSKKLTKISVMILTFIFACCMAVASVSFSNVRATDGTTFEMIDGAQVTTSGEMGIRFAATISASEYNTLKQNGVSEFGMIIAPADYVSNEDNFKVGVMKEYGKDTINEGEFFYNRGTTTPRLDEDDYDKDGDKSEYVLLCSFVGIKETNFSRGFKARAYYLNGTTYTHTEDVASTADTNEGVATRTVYTVVSRFVESDEFDPSDETVSTYVNNILDKVNAVYTKYNVTIENANDGVAYVEDNLVVKATVSKPDGSKTLDAGVNVSVYTVEEEGEGELVEDALTLGNGCYQASISGVYNLVAKSGSLTKTLPLIIKRTGVSITGENIPFSVYDHTSAALPMGSSIIGKFIVTDPEVEGYEEGAMPDVTKVKVKFEVSDAENSWVKVPGNYPTWLQVQQGVEIMGDKTVIATYTDAYGVPYSCEVKALAPAYSFGKTEKFTATDVLKTNLRTNAWLTFKNVPLTDLASEDFLRFTFENTGADGVIESRMWKFRLSEPGNSSNYVDFYVGGFASLGSGLTHTVAGMAVPTWNLTGIAAYGLRGSAFMPLKSYPANSYTGWYYDNYKLFRAMGGGSLYSKDPAKYIYEMFGFSVISSEIFVNAGADDKTWKNVAASVLPKATQLTREECNKTAFTGFDSLENLDVSIQLVTAGGNDAALNGATMLIEYLGGEKLTSAPTNAYYSVGATPYLVDTIAE